MLKVLFIGDIVSRLGREAIKEFVPQIKKENNIDVVIANCENATDGRGINVNHYNELLGYGIDAFTAGEHIYRVESIKDYIDELNIAVPLNFYSTQPGKRFVEIDTGKNGVLTIVSLIGMSIEKAQVKNPFHVISDFIEENPDKTILVDFHAEFTSEKRAMLHFAKNKVAAIVGTHTHVPTADEQILENTAYITDVGMTGSTDSVIGVKKEIIINRFNKGENTRFEWQKEGPYELNGVVISIDTQTRIAKNIHRVSLKSR